MNDLTAAQKVKQEIDLQNEFEKHLNSNPKELTLKYLVDHGLQVFVKSNTRVAAVILCEVQDQSGRKITINIDNTNIPIELTAKVDHASLGKSFHLRKLLDDRMIVLMNPAQARIELQDPIAQRKLARLSTSKFSKDSDERIPDSYNKKPVADTLNIVPGMPNQVVSTNQVSNSLKGLVVSMQEKTIDADTFFDKVTDNARTYSLADWQFLQSTFPNNEDIQMVCAREISIAAGNEQTIPNA
jgi:hypothetical protein